MNNAERWCKKTLAIFIVFGIIFCGFYVMHNNLPKNIQAHEFHNLDIDNTQSSAKHSSVDYDAGLVELFDDSAEGLQK